MRCAFACRGGLVSRRRQAIVPVRRGERVSLHPSGSFAGHWQDKYRLHCDFLFFIAATEQASHCPKASRSQQPGQDCAKVEG